MTHNTQMRLLPLLLLLILVSSPFSFAQADDDDEFFDDVPAAAPAPKTGIHIDLKKEGKLQVAEDDFAFDEDEFEGLEEIKRAAQLKKEAEIVEESEGLPEIEEPKRGYGLETLYILFIISYVANYFLGKKENEGIANAWALSCEELYSANFSRFGDIPDFKVVRENPNQFYVACAGRQNCYGAHVTLDLIRRHDIVSQLIKYVSARYDTCTIDVAIPEALMDQFVFFVCKKKDEKKLIAEFPDLAKFAVSVSHPLPKTFSVLTDSEELVESVLTKAVITTITNNEPYFHYMHFTDQADYISDKYKRIVRFVFKLPAKVDMGKILVLNRLAFHLVDEIAAISKGLKQGTRVKNERSRSSLTAVTKKQAEELRQEQALKRKQDQKQKELERFEKMAPEAQRKFEERQHKKELKEKSKMRVVYG